MRIILLYLLVWQLHVELLIVDPLGADDGLGVLVGFQLLRVAVELHKLVSRLQLGISRHFTWTKKYFTLALLVLLVTYIMSEEAYMNNNTRNILFSFF